MAVYNPFRGSCIRGFVPISKGKFVSRICACNVFMEESRYVLFRVLATEYIFLLEMKQG
jgi:hypothetical protein